MAQVWDQVKVNAGSYAGDAGTVQAVNAKEEVSLVKLDDKAGEKPTEPQWFKDSELTFLGR